MSDFAKKILYIIENKQFEKTKNLFSFEEKIKLLA